MAFPVIAGTNTTSVAATTSHVVNLPASIAAGDLLVIAHHSVDAVFTYPTGWAEISNGVVGSRRLIIAWKIADGTEGATITVTSDVSGPSRWLADRITGWHGTTPPEVGTMATGSSTTPDPPSVTPSWGSADQLFIAYSAKVNAVDPTGNPTNYSLSALTLSANSANIANAGRQLTASSDDPGTFTYAASTQWGAQTLVIRPAIPAVPFGWFETFAARPKGSVKAPISLTAVPPLVDTTINFGWFEPYAKRTVVSKISAGSIAMPPQGIVVTPALPFGWFEPYAKRPPIVPARRTSFNTTACVFKFTPAIPAVAQPGAILLCGL